MTTYLQNCTIMDGMGNPAFNSGIVLQDGRIAAITATPPEDTQVLNCTGLTAAPGFIDAHSHNDWFALGQEAATYFRPFIRQGITTFVVGNCGFSAYGYNGNTLHVNEVGGLFTLNAVTRRYPAFSEWAKAADGCAPANLAPLVGHGTVRTGIRGKGAGALTPAEMSQMLTLLEDALQGGALGVSLGLMYEPGIFAPKEELLEVAKLVKKYDRVLTVHPKAESSISLSYPLLAGSHLLIALRELADIVRETGVKLQYSHLIFVGRRTWKDEGAALEIFEGLRAKGYDVMFETDKDKVPEIGYLFNRTCWHKGYAAEAAIACKRYAFDVLGFDEVFSLVRDTNYPSMNVAIRAGMLVRGRFTKHYRGEDMPHYIFSVRKCGEGNHIVKEDGE